MMRESRESMLLACLVSILAHMCIGYVKLSHEFYPFFFLNFYFIVENIVVWFLCLMAYQPSSVI